MNWVIALNLSNICSNMNQETNINNITYKKWLLHGERHNQATRLQLTAFKATCFNPAYTFTVEDGKIAQNLASKFYVTPRTVINCHSSQPLLKINNSSAEAKRKYLKRMEHGRLAYQTELELLTCQYFALASQDLSKLRSVPSNSEHSDFPMGHFNTP